MEQILVTGGLGFVGYHLVHRLVQRTDVNVSIVDDLSYGFLENLPPKEYTNWEYYQLNVNRYEDLADLMLKKSFDIVYHLAATVGVEQTMNNPIAVMDDLKGIEHILKISSQTDVKKVLFSSSSEVYGNSACFPQNEDLSPLNAKNPYAVVKSAGEVFHRIYAQQSQLNYTIFRLFNLYGPRQRRDFVISKFLHAALRNEDITIYGNGNQSRTFCWIDDAIEVMVNAMNAPEVHNTVMNVGSQEEISINNLAKCIANKVTSTSRLIHTTSSVDYNRISKRLPDIHRMKSLLKRDLTPFEYRTGYDY